MDGAIDVHRDPSREYRQQSMDRGVAVAFITGATPVRTSHHFTQHYSAFLSEMCDQMHQMPQDPRLFTHEIVDAKALRRRVDVWIDKTLYVLRKMKEQGYCRMGKAEAFEMVEKMAERISGITVAYRHLLDAYTIVSFINHLVRCSDALINKEHLIKTHELLLADLYSKAFLHVEGMTPGGVSQILGSYHVFQNGAKKICFKKDTSRYPAEMTHELLVRKLLERFKATMHLALPSHLLQTVASLYTIDSGMKEMADQIFERLIESFRVDTSPLHTVAEFLYCLGLWGLKGMKNRSMAVQLLVARIEAATDQEIKELSASAFAKMVYAFGCLELKKSSSVAIRTRIWFDERFNGYAMSPRDLALCAFGYAFSDAFDEDLIYLIKKQALRRSGYYKPADLLILGRGFARMGLVFDDVMEVQLLSGDKRVYERSYQKPYYDLWRKPRWQKGEPTK